MRKRDFTWIFSYELREKYENVKFFAGCLKLYPFRKRTMVNGYIRS